MPCELIFFFFIVSSSSQGCSKLKLGKVLQYRHDYDVYIDADRVIAYTGIYNIESYFGFTMSAGCIYNGDSVKWNINH